MPLYVCKFGGTSLATGERVLAARDLVRAHPARRVVVVSAPGRRFPGDEKVTDLLLRYFHGREARVWRDIEARFREIARCAGQEIDEELARALRGIESCADADFAASRGEFLLARIFARALDYAFIDAADCVRFGENGLCAQKTRRLLRKCLDPARGCVLPGFYGAAACGRVRAFPRGGSDITGALAASALCADAYENWTDVDGVFDCDPAQNPGARGLPEITYEDMRALCLRGACVIHPDALAPVRNAGIPVHVKNTMNPAAPGTWIRAQSANLSRMRHNV